MFTAMMNQQDPFELLPEAEIKETFWFREYWFDGKCFEKHFFLKVWFQEAHEAYLNRFWKVYVTYPFAKWLIKDWGAACPHCNKIIMVAKWEKTNKSVKE